MNPFHALQKVVGNARQDLHTVLFDIPAAAAQAANRSTPWGQASQQHVNQPAAHPNASPMLHTPVPMPILPTNLPKQQLGGGFSNQHPGQTIQQTMYGTPGRVGQTNPAPMQSSPAYLKPANSNTPNYALPYDTTTLPAELPTMPHLQKRYR